ncbi:hypothetical protein THOG11_250024 [Vibrio harveyi]|nr:hypothetical protein TH15OA1_40023 [Vibrio harveyi]CAH1536262.1 hypothetical protein VHARVF571_40035 [Vibrio harveyi]CAH1561290.1 hypothetical protein THOD03_270036 [Vibrio harveyi]CAH1567622.1 hypothetical protein THOG11_250024 [Vibrio harveyi]CAK6713901.1 hypothetical protein HORM4_20023 [Vibrio harveyi]
MKTFQLGKSNLISVTLCHLEYSGLYPSSKLGRLGIVSLY